MSDAEALKRAAAAEALRRVQSGMRLGLGTGSTMAHLLDLLGEAMAEGRIADVVGVPTSERTRVHAERLGIPLAPLSDIVPLDLAIDGADEFDPRLDLVKGLGGALVREKIVAQEAARFVVIVDESKEVARLGEKAPLPVEVVEYEWRSHLPFFRTLGAEPVLRATDGDPYRTDNGNLIVDLSFADGIADARALQTALLERAGVVDTGLFLGMATEVLVAAPGGIRTLEASR